MFMHHIAMFGELPFHPRVPNKETLKTFQDTDANVSLTRYTSVDDIFSEVE
jgi:antitoxin component of RelBE/YafQ-DinJ toxin-antitoxin module